MQADLNKKDEANVKQKELIETKIKALQKADLELKEKVILLFFF